MEANAPLLILFDGHCNLCSGAVKFIYHRDSRHVFRFAPLSGPTAERIMQGSSPGDRPDSFVLVEGDRIHFRSTAALRVAKRLDGAWPLLYAFILVPGPIRDAVYRLISRKRYGWFGKRDTCFLPPPGWEEWFPDQQQ